MLQVTGQSSKAGQFRALSVLIAVAFVDMLGFAMILPLLPFYALHLNVSPQLIGLIIASFSMAQLLSAPIWGRVSDHYGRRPALLIGLTAAAISYVVFGFANSFWLLLGSRVIQGAGGGTTGVVHAYVADTVPSEDRTRSLGWLSAATSAGVMIGPVVGSTAAFWGQWAPGLLAAVLCVMNILFAWRWLPESSKNIEDTRTRKRPPVWHSAWRVLRHPARTVSRLVWIYALGMFAFSSFTSIIAIYLGFEFSINERNIGYIFLYTGLLSVLIRSLLLGSIVSRFGETWTMRLGATSLLVGFFSFPFAGDFWMTLLVMSLVPVGTALTFPSTTALTSHWSEKGELGTTMGTAQAFAGMSRSVSPLISTALFQHIGHSIPFFAGAFCAGCVVALSLRVSDPEHDSSRAAGGQAAPLLEEEPVES